MGDIEIRRSHVMNASHPISQHAVHYELCFRPLKGEGRVPAFPCDAEGHVDIDSLSARARLDYFYARTVIGREFALPAVQPTTLH
jgi:hypothetical protein